MEYKLSETLLFALRTLRLRIKTVKGDKIRAKNTKKLDEIKRNFNKEIL